MTNFPTIRERQIADTPTQTVNAHELWKFLRVRSGFGNWIERRIRIYGFLPDRDFLSFLTKTPNVGRPRKEYHLTIDMAKELAMVERTPRGRQVRRYFIECERKLLAERKAHLDQEEQRIFKHGRSEGLVDGMLLTMDLRRLQISYDKLCNIVWLRMQGLTQGETGRVVKLAKHRIQEVEKALRLVSVKIPTAFTHPRKKRAEKLLFDLLGGPIYKGPKWSLLDHSGSGKEQNRPDDDPERHPAQNPHPGPLPGGEGERQVVTHV